MTDVHKMFVGSAALDQQLALLGEAFDAGAVAPRQPKDNEMTDHAAATAEALEKVIAMLKAGQSPEDLGPMVILIGRMMARRT